MPSWLSGWTYRKSHVINGSTAGAVTDYQIRIKVHYGSGTSSGEDVYLNGNSRTDFGDVRFTDSDGVTLLSYWIEEKVDGDYAIIWVKVPSIPASPATTTIYIYYGNPTATTTSNGNNTFVFFDDFIGTSLDTTKWATVGGKGTVSVANGLLTLTNPKYIVSANSYAGGYAFRARAKCGADTVGISWGGFTTTAGATANRDLTLAWYYYSTATYFRFNSGDGTNYQIIDSGVALETANFHVVEARRTGTVDKFQIDNDTEKTGSYPTNLARYLTFYAYSADVVVDWVLVRKYVDPEPSHGAWGSTEATIMLTESLSLSDTPQKVISKSVSDSFSLSDTVVKSTSKALSDTASLSDLIYKAIGKSPFTETLSLSDLISKSTEKSLSDSFSLLDSIVKVVSKTVSDSLSLSDILSIGIIYTLTLIDSFSLSDSLVKRIDKPVSDSLSLSDLISRTTAKLLSDSLSLSDVLSRSTAKPLLDSLSLTDMIAKATSKSISDSILLSDVLTRGRVLTDSLSLSDALSKGISKRLLDNIAIGDLLGKQVSVSLVDVVRLYATMDKRRKPPPPALATIPYVTPDGRVIDVKFSTLDHLMFGFILGVSKLGFGVLLPRTSIFNQEDGKKNPVFLELMRKKAKGIIDRHSLTAWSYALYNRPDEMVDYHKSERTAQYDLLQTQRRFIEDWVANRISKVVTSKVMIRQYQNAVLQAVSWKAMRHKWGYSPFRITPEEKFKDWWVANWKAQGLDENILLDLYNSLESIIQALRDTKYSIGEGVKRRRRMLSGSPL